MSICQLHQKAHRKTDNKFNSKTFASCSLLLGASQKYFHIHLMISALEPEPKSKCKFFYRNLRISLSPAMVFHVLLLPYHALCFDVYCHLISKFPYAIPGFTWMLCSGFHQFRVEVCLFDVLERNAIIPLHSQTHWNIICDGPFGTRQPCSFI